MYQEVSSLRAVHASSAKVPAVLASNTDTFEDPSTQLYFVMERINGETLTAAVSQHGPLSSSQSIGLCLDLASTILIGHNLQVLHRDLKPDNIIVRNLASNDTVVVDYGLSFNREEDVESTQEGERFRNNFLDLPEYSAQGDNRRDPRSDVTALAGIFFYCLTKHAPRVLRDGQNLPPHRRSATSLRSILVTSPALNALELLFDKAFSQEVEYRFQNVTDFVERLKGLLLSDDKKLKRDPIEVAKATAQMLRIKDPISRAAGFARSSTQVFDIVKTRLERLGSPEGFSIGFGSASNQLPLPNQRVQVSQRPFFVTVTPTGHHNKSRHLYFSVGLDGNQCVILRSDSLPGSPYEHSESQRRLEAMYYGWKACLWYDGKELNQAATDELAEEVDRAVSELIETVAGDVAG
jgi:serine/threonine protein kinase